MRPVGDAKAKECAASGRAGESTGRLGKALSDHVCSEHRHSAPQPAHLFPIPCCSCPVPFVFPLFSTPSPLCCIPILILILILILTLILTPSPAICTPPPPHNLVDDKQRPAAARLRLRKRPHNQ